MHTTTSLSDLFAGEPTIEHGRRVRTASVAWFDEVALLHDFPDLASVIGAGTGTAEQGCPQLGPIQRARLVEWLLRVGPMISEAQLASMAANDPVDIEEEIIPFVRPTYYGRATMLDLAAVQAAAGVRGVLDIKGCGVRKGRKPSKTSHGTGLQTLSEALTDLAIQRIVERALSVVGANITCVPLYAIFSLGFDCFPAFAETGPVPAAITLRRACLRAPTWASTIQMEDGMAVEQKNDLARLCWRIELLFRKFGITSTMPQRHNDSYIHVPVPQLAALVDILGCNPALDFDNINVQLTANMCADPIRAELIDFGHYRFADRFDAHLINMSGDHFDGSITKLWNHDPGWVQPDPALRVDMQVLGRKPYSEAVRRWSSCAEGAQAHAIRLLGVELAYAHSQEGADSGAIEQAITEFVAAALPLTGVL